jgi:hypothetical protein
MWNNSGFHGLGNFQQGQTDFHLGQENYQQNFQDDGYIPFSSAPFGQQYFPQQQPLDGIQYNNTSLYTEQSTPCGYEPEIGLYNEGSVAHNQIVSSDGPVSIILLAQALM